MAKISVDGLNFSAIITEFEAYYIKAGKTVTLTKSSGIADEIIGGNGTDYIEAGAGADTVSGGNGKDTLFGGAGDDKMYGDGVKSLDTTENGADTIYGGAGKDSIFGGNGADILYGDEKNAGKSPADTSLITAIATTTDTILATYRDTIDGGASGDRITGGLGGDTLTGGAGPDVFVYDRIADSRSASGECVAQSAGTSAADWQADTSDVITDFTKGQDKLDFTALNTANTALHFTGGSAPAANGIWSLIVPATPGNPTATYLFADSDGDGKADIAIKVNGAVNFSASDFIGVNDGPTITSDGGGATASFTVAENTTAVTDVNATDPDGDTLSYSILNTAGTDFGKFTIDSNGVLKFITGPNFENPADVGGVDGDNTYVVDVQVSDGNGGFDVQTITVNVTNVNDNGVVGPTDNNVATDTVAENAAVGTVVGVTALATDADAGATVTYSLTDDAGGKFAINGTTGVVTVAGAINYEAATSHSITVLATSSDGSTNSNTFVIGVGNLDEVAPTITSGASAGTIDENVTAGQVVYTATATDTGDISAGVTFSLGGTDAALFDIDSGTGAVTLIGSPDHEIQSSYSFTVLADDGVNTPTEQAVSLTVNNLDEVAPTVTSGASAGTIDENVTAGQVVYTATATDTGDISAGVTFSLGGTDAALFDIDSGTGAVTLIGSPDHEIQSSYSFTVLADDGVNTPTEQAVSLTVNDLDEVAPTITSGASAGTIDENVTAGQVVYTATATDTGDISAGVTFSLGGTDAALFNIDSGTGVVTLIGSPDHEIQSSYSFTVLADDGVNTPTEQAVSLTVNDLDEVAPTITSGASAGTIDENVTAGQVVYTATATDTGDISAGVTFSLGGTDAALFNIDSGTGVVTLIGSPDHEIQSSYSFTVLADDGVNTPTEQAVSLTVNNLDEVAPTVTSGASAGTIDENVTAGQVVYTATATDTGDISAGVTFSLGGTDAALFDIDSGTGAVTLIGSPDHEIQSSYSFTVLADDGVNTPTEQAVSLTVNNLDEVAPTVTSGASAGTIDENVTAGQVVYTATATDTGDISAGVTFSLGGTDAALFDIDSGTGAVTLIGSPDHEIQSSYSFTVLADDGVNTPTEQAVSLTVNNLDDNGVVGPTDNNVATDTVAENAALGTVVGITALATDADAGATITYSLTNSAGGKFAINSTTGVVTVAGTLDYETSTSHAITVLATSSDGSTNSAGFTIGVTDVNEGNPPVAVDDVFVISDVTPIASGIMTAAWFTRNDTDTESDPIFVTAVSGLPAGLTANFDGSGHLIDITGTSPAAGTYNLTYTLNGGDTGAVTLKVLDTTSGADTITSAMLDGSDFSYIDCLSGADNVTGDLTLTGNAGIDTFLGNNLNDILNGGAGNDFLFGNDNNDTLDGGAGNDVLNGGNNNDILIGGAGADTLTGGNGNDTFRFNLVSEAGDTILDFSAADDTIEINNASFTALGVDGTLAAAAFDVVGVGAAATAATRIIYDGSTGALYYDADGSGAGGATQIAQMATGLTLTNADFTVI